MNPSRSRHCCGIVILAMEETATREATMRATWEVFSRGPGWPDAYKIGGEKDFVSVDSSSSSFGEADVWDIHLHLCGAGTLQEVRGLDKAKRIAEFLYDELLPEQKARVERSEARWQEHERERALRVEEERPAREKAARERTTRLSKIEPEEVAKCPECTHLDEDDEFGVPGYECSRCGSTGRGEDGRRCDQCHIFRARVSSFTCPSCEVPLEEPETVMAKRDGNELIEAEVA